MFVLFLCYQGIGETNGRRPTNGDLAGFWDMVMIQVCTASKKKGAKIATKDGLCLAIFEKVHS